MAQGAPGIESRAMKTDYDPFSEENLARVRAKQLSRSGTQRSREILQKNGQKPPTQKPRKEPEIDFLAVNLALWHKLVDNNAGRSEWAMVGALCEAWFRAGVPRKHLNPFPLSAANTEKWSLTRKQRSRALQFLNQAHLISIDRTDPKNPRITLNWVDLFQPEV